MNVPYIKDDKKFPVPVDYIEPSDVNSKLLVGKTEVRETSFAVS